jgi:DNA-binding NtrC family response regulator
VNDQLEALISQMIDRGVHYSDAISVFQKRFIQKALKSYGGNKSKTAKALGIHRNTLSRMIEANGHQPGRKPPR